MTVEHRLLFGLADIVAVTIECIEPDCGARLSVSPDRRDHSSLEQCPGCRRPWLGAEPQFNHLSAGSTAVLLQALTVSRSAKTPVFRLLLEFANTLPSVAR